MQLEKQSLNVPQAIAAGTALALKPFQQTYTMWFSLSGAVMTGQLQLSNFEGGPWVNEGAAFSADAAIDVSKKALFARVNVTAYTSGQGIVEIVGLV
jgi:hypothetical protein